MPAQSMLVTFGEGRGATSWVSSLYTAMLCDNTHSYQCHCIDHNICPLAQPMP
eukprot:COSAG06_NODE_22_length_33148_cov_102.016279_39_plen_53_part_00